jgi:hypothetical protein
MMHRCLGRVRRLRRLAAGAAIVAAAIGFLLPPARAAGPLRVHPDNPRYFADDGGRAILLAGSHTWPNVVDMGPGDPPPAFDFEAHLVWLAGYGHKLTRGWTWEPTRWHTSGMKNPANNVNGIDADVDGDGKGIEVHQLVQPRVTRLQEAYVRRIVETLNRFDNLLYEIGNETHPCSVDFQYHMTRFVKEVEAGLPKQHPVGMPQGGRKENADAAGWASGPPAAPPAVTGIETLFSGLPRPASQKPAKTGSDPDGRGRSQPVKIIPGGVLPQPMTC